MFSGNPDCLVNCYRDSLSCLVTSDLKPVLRPPPPRRKSAPKPNTQKLLDASSWHFHTIFSPNSKLFYPAYKTAFILLHKRGRGPSVRKAHGAPSWARLQQTSAERVGTLWYLFTFLPMNPSLLQVRLASFCSTLPRSFLLDDTWALSHFPITGQFKDFQIGCGS